MSKRFEFIYDLASSPSYLAWTQLPAIVEETGAQLILTPVLVAGIFKAIDNPGPLAVPAKAKWMTSDFAMWAKHYAVAFNQNPHFPIRTLPLMRGALVAEDRGELAPYVKIMFEAIWVLEKDLNDPEEVRATLANAGLDPGTYFSQIERQDIKDRLRKYTDDAVARGVFGTPTFFVGDQMFFGQDRLHFVRDALHKL